MPEILYYRRHRFDALFTLLTGQSPIFPSENTHLRKGADQQEPSAPGIPGNAPNP